MSNIFSDVSSVLILSDESYKNLKISNELLVE